MSDFDPTTDLDLDFDPSTHERSPSSFEPLPAGTYSARVSGVRLQPTKDGGMRQAVIELTILDDDYAGRRVWARHTVAITRTDEGGKKSLAIGRDQIAELFAAAGVGGTSMAPLVDKEVKVKLKVRPASGNFDASNDVKGYAPISGAAAPAAAGKPPAPAGSKPAGATGGGRPAFMSRG